MERPTALKSGEFYDIELPLYMAAHRFRKGNRIRAAVSESLWPLIWPSPQIATLQIALGASHLVLPVRPIPRKEAPFTIPVIHAGRGGPTPTPDRAQMPIRDATGRIRYDSNGAPDTTFVSAVGTSITTVSSRIIEVTEGEPNSCRMNLDHTSRWKRDDWDCAIQFGADLTSTAEEFHLKEWLVAKKGDVEIFRRGRQAL